jgi:hypothetical protein
MAIEPAEVADKVHAIFANDAAGWRKWSTNIAQLSRPRASLDIAEFLMGL